MLALVAPRLVPWLLGERWTEAGRLLTWMAGFAGGISLLEFGKSSLLVEGRVTSLLLVRLAQVSGLGLGLVALLWLEPAEALAAALSVATIVGAATAYARISAYASRV